MLACLACILIRKVDACAGGSDSSGYMNQARLLAEGRIHVPMRVLPGLDTTGFSDYLYSPLGFRPDHDTIVPTYPIGLPLLILAAAAVVGWAQAANVVIVLHALAAVILLYALARELLLGWRGGLVASVCLAASPLFLFFSVQAMSDLPALTWVCATAWTAWRARRHAGWAVATGFCFSVAVLVRPTNVLLAPALLVAWWPLTARRVLGAVAAGLPGAAGLLLYNRAAYGSPFATGYGEAGSLFQRGVVEETLAHYAHWLPLLFSPAVILFLLLPLRPSRTAWFLFLWAFAYLAFYVCYYHTHETWWYLRFVLPAAPA
ncbi:MAG TPA: glycosyltransferase family 39 protein, partial [Opitutaceae bacterium]|nr:glycosyltransferase family 39 protein [Opitutaceae bacterium]